MSRKQTIKTENGTIVAEPWEPPTKKAKSAKPFNIATAERHLQIIAQWERLGYIIPAKAKQLRDRVLEEINR